MPTGTKGSNAASLAPDSFFPETGGANPDGLASSPEHQARHRWAQCVDDLLAVRRLKDDWDGLGAQAPAGDLVDSAIDLLQILMNQDELPPPTRIVATPTGTVLFEWQMDCVYLEGEITEPYHADWMLEHPRGCIEHEETTWPPRRQREHASQPSVAASETHCRTCGDVAVSV